MLGSGAHSRVYSASYFKTPVAVKQYRKAAFDTFMREFSFYERVQRMSLAHPGFLSFIGAFSRPINTQLATKSREENQQKRYCIVTEVAHYSTLSQILFSKSQVDSVSATHSRIKFIDKLQIAI